MCSKKMLIVKSLENLSKINWKKFRLALVERPGDRRVPLSKVEDKDIFEITDALVSTFTADTALAVTCELLESIDCFNEANELNDQIAEMFPKSSTSKTVAATAAGTADGTTHSKEEHFVDKHRGELTKRVREVYFILDFLRDKNVITSEIHQEISNMPGNFPSRMEKIYALAVMSDITAKDIFFESLKKFVPGLVVELEHSVVAPKWLRPIKSFDKAQKLDDEIAKPNSSAGKTTASAAAAGPAGTATHSKEKHFVDKHMPELIQRVSSIKPILDVLRSKDVIQRETYEEIFKTPENQDKMRKIYMLALKSGKAANDIFYECLKKYESHLVADLELSEQKSNHDIMLS
ncbi:apoptosis-associated speck-like protein containing a CARD isoform X2 [Festucalex cinctus]